MTFLRVLSRADQSQKRNVPSKELGYKEYLSKNQYAFESTDGKLIYTFGIIGKVYFFNKNKIFLQATGLQSSWKVFISGIGLGGMYPVYRLMSMPTGFGILSKIQWWFLVII
jgi:hypothetical protein